MQRFDWDDLKRELDLWGEAGRVADLWWRDDDATEATPALDRLLALAAGSDVEIGLAVIPVGASEGLAATLAERSHVAVFQHGYRHTNHAPRGAPAVELGGARPVDTVLHEMRDGYGRLQALLPSSFEPILAAPWNHIDRPVLDRLAEAEFIGASAYGPRLQMAGTHGLVIANAHLDPLNWKAGGRFAGLAKALSGLIGELSARRTGETERDEPLGLLTHHLVHDADTWDFLKRLLSLTRAHPAARWLDARTVFGLKPAALVAMAEARA